jgi:hypothetical protein
VVVLLLVLTGCTPGAPAAGPTPTTSSPLAFVAEDGVLLQGKVYGAGSTAVVMSNMGDNDPTLWEEFAPALAGEGYLVLTYSFRYPPRTRTFTEAMARGTVPDLLGAVAYVRGLGATGWSWSGRAWRHRDRQGGRYGRRRAVAIPPPQDLSEYGLAVTSSELAAITGPKAVHRQ